MGRNSAIRVIMGIGLIVLSVALFVTASTADLPTTNTHRIDYPYAAQTPLLSARRLPETIQGAMGDDDIANDTDTWIRNSSTTTCLVMQRNGHHLVENINPDIGLVPASTQKLVTTYTALSLLGKDHQFETRVVASTPPDVSGSVGTLYLVGGGDPYLTTSNWWDQYPDTTHRSSTSLEELADLVAASGLKSITGTIVGDESYFDTTRYGRWAQRLIDQQQSGPLSALAVNEGFEQWGDHYLALSQRVPASEPAVHAAVLFGELLRQRGIDVPDSHTVGVAPAGATEIASIKSDTLADIAVSVNSMSLNFGAELLLKHVGKAGANNGSAAAGAQVVLKTLNEAGFSTNNLEIFDGSGLSEDNRLTCRFLAELIAKSPPELGLAETLSIAGERGSLDESFQGTAAAGKVIAKTGSLNGVSALSGLSGDPDDHPDSIIFAYITNDQALSSRPLNVRSALIAELGKYPEAPSLESLGPLPAKSSED